MSQDSNEKNSERIKLLLKPGQLVKVDTDYHKDVILGEILEFIKYDYWAGGYVLKNSKGIRIVFSDDRSFVTFPKKDEIMQLIDVVLVLGDKQWFEDLVYVLKYETESSIKKIRE